jgi:uncharacterized protein YegL
VKPGSYELATFKPYHGEDKMGFLTSRKATSTTPQVVTLVVDDSGSMEGEKARQATAALQDMLLQMQSSNLNASGSRFLVNVAKFGDQPMPITVAAKPNEVDLSSLIFAGESGKTDIPAALTWAAGAVGEALERCRKDALYREAESPTPLVVLFSDGANTGTDVGPAAAALKAIQFQSGFIDVVACAIGMEPSDFPVMQTIASRPELAINIDPSKLGDFIAEVGATILNNRRAEELVDNSRQMRASF